MNFYMTSLAKKKKKNVVSIAICVKVYKSAGKSIGSSGKLNAVKRSTNKPVGRD